MPLLTEYLIGALAVFKYADWQWVDIALRPRASGGIGKTLTVWILRSRVSVWILGLESPTTRHLNILFL